MGLSISRAAFIDACVGRTRSTTMRECESKGSIAPHRAKLTPQVPQRPTLGVPTPVVSRWCGRRCRDRPDRIRARGQRRPDPCQRHQVHAGQLPDRRAVDDDERIAIAGTDRLGVFVRLAVGAALAVAPGAFLEEADNGPGQVGMDRTQTADDFVGQGDRHELAKAGPIWTVVHACGARPRVLRRTSACGCSANGWAQKSPDENNTPEF